MRLRGRASAKLIRNLSDPDRLSCSLTLRGVLEGLNQLRMTRLTVAQLEPAVVARDFAGSRADVIIFTKPSESLLAIGDPVGDPEDSLALVEGVTDKLLR